METVFGLLMIGGMVGGILHMVYASKHPQVFVDEERDKRNETGNSQARRGVNGLFGNSGWWR